MGLVQAPIDVGEPLVGPFPEDGLDWACVSERERSREREREREMDGS